MSDLDEANVGPYLSDKIQLASNTILTIVSDHFSYKQGSYEEATRCRTNRYKTSSTLVTPSSLCFFSVPNTIVMQSQEFGRSDLPHNLSFKV